MRVWRKSTWAIVLWTALFVVWIAAGVSGVSNRCDGLTGQELSVCQAGTAIGGGIGVTLLIFLWLIGAAILTIIWFASRPRGTVTVFGPNGEEARLPEREATKRVQRGWTYQRQQAAVPPSPWTENQ